MRGGSLEVIKINDKVLGVLLEAEHCAEHEWGIKPLQNTLGIDSTKLGVEGRQTSNTENLYSGKDWFWLGHGNVNTPTKLDVLGLYGYIKHAVASGLWYDSEAAAALNKSATDDHKLAFKLIHECIKNKQPLFVMRGGSGPFGGGGLVVCPAALVPEEVRLSLYQADVARDELASAWKPVEAMLIEKRKEVKPTEFHQWVSQWRDAWYRPEELCRWMALVPRQLEDAPVDGSHYRFKLWLNPEQQQLNEAGWYTVEQILEWFKGKGPVIEGSAYYKLWVAQKAVLKGEVAYPIDYYAICPKCGHIHYDGNARGRNEFLGTVPANERTWSTCRVKVLTKCTACGIPASELVFSTDDPEHWTNKKKA